MGMSHVLSKVNVLASYIGQKVVLADRVDWCNFRYPPGAVGTLDAIQSDGKGGVVALVVFDEDRTQDWVEVKIEDIAPAEFAPAELVALKPRIDYTPLYRLEMLKEKWSLETNKQ